MKYNYCKQITNGVELHPVECLPGEMYDWAKVKFRHVRICITHVGQTPWLHAATPIKDWSYVYYHFFTHRQ